MSEATEAALVELVRDIEERLANIETNIALQTQALQTHTDSDSANFTSLNTALSTIQSDVGGLRSDIHQLQLARARDEGEKQAAEEAGKLSGAKWGAGVGAAVGAAAAAVFEFFRWASN